MDCKREGEHSWYRSRLWALARDGHQCVRCGATEQLEVNHIEPRRGQGYGPGCHNHLDNLETLCKPHHLEVTREQRKAYRRPSARDYLAVDARRRVNIHSWRSEHTDYYVMEVHDDGKVVLRPAAVVTDPEVVRSGEGAL